MESPEKPAAAPAAAPAAKQLRPNEDPEAATSKGKKGTPPPPGPRYPRAGAEVVSADGAPAFGAFHGSFDSIKWDGLRGPHAHNKLWHLLHHKKWTYVGVGTPELSIALAIFQAGYLATSFCYVWSRKEQRFLAERSLLAAPRLEVKVAEFPAYGLSASFARGKRTASISREVGSFLYLVKTSWDGLEIDVQLDTRWYGQALTSVCPIEGGVANATQKTGPLPARGKVVIDGKLYALDGATEGWGALDYTNGLLARDTRWRWASMNGQIPQGPAVGLNLVTGFNQPRPGTHSGENAIWIDRDVIPVGAAKIDCDPAQPERPWHISTEDGKVDLEFRPEAVRRENTDAKLVKSAYVQPIGTYHGSIKNADGKPLSIDGLIGVAEDHSARW